MSIYIETPRLIIRTPVIADIEMIQTAKMTAWDDLRLWMSWAVPGTETVESLRDYFIAGAEEKNHLIAVTKDDGAFVLCTGATPMEQNIFEVGYWAARNMRGYGYAAEAANAVIRYAFDQLDAAQIYICHYEGNKPSQNVIEKLGFTKTGVTAKAFTRDVDGAVLDRHEYIMTDVTALPDLDVIWRQRCP